MFSNYSLWTLLLSTKSVTSEPWVVAPGRLCPRPPAAGPGRGAAELTPPPASGPPPAAAPPVPSRPRELRRRPKSSPSPAAAERPASATATPLQSSLSNLCRGSQRPARMRARNTHKAFPAANSRARTSRGRASCGSALAPRRGPCAPPPRDRAHVTGPWASSHPAGHRWPSLTSVYWDLVNGVWGDVSPGITVKPRGKKRDEGGRPQENYVSQRLGADPHSGSSSGHVGSPRACMISFGPRGTRRVE